MLSGLFSIHRCHQLLSFKIVDNLVSILIQIFDGCEEFVLYLSFPVFAYILSESKHVLHVLNKHVITHEPHCSILSVQKFTGGQIFAVHLINKVIHISFIRDITYIFQAIRNHFLKSPYLVMGRVMQEGIDEGLGNKVFHVCTGSNIMD